MKAPKGFKHVELYPDAETGRYNVHEYIYVEDVLVQNDDGTLRKILDSDFKPGFIYYIAKSSGNEQIIAWGPYTSK